jgi:predicted Zn finger-like uncharacterized protein
MNVSCPECRSVFRLDPAKITSVSMRARCSVCGGLIPVGAAVSWGDDLPAIPVSPRAAAPALATPAGVKPVFSRARTPAPSATAWPPPIPRPEPRTAAPPAPRPAAPPPATATSALPNQNVSSPRHRTPPFSPKFTPGVARDSAAPPKAAAATDAKPRSAPDIGASFGAPLTPPSRTSIPEAVPAPKSPASPSFTASSSVSAAFSTPSTPAPSPAVVQRKPINPFLANDPNQKARRLARALVSDMVAYHPSKREEGLKGGTLKQLFRDEIKKSYEEYVEQVGREFAESTVHFQEALNDVLAGGRKVF